MKKINSQLSSKQKGKKAHINSQKVHPPNQPDKTTSTTKNDGGKSNTDIKKKKKNNIQKININPSSGNSNLQSLKDKIFSPGDFIQTKNESKNRKMIIELSKKLLEYTSNIFKTNERNNNFQKNRSLPKYLPEKSSPFAKKKTLILDLDETLVHSALKPFKTQPDMILTIPFEQNKQTVYVLKRPHVDEFLETVSKMFEVVIFTAGIQDYANPLLDKLDKSKCIKYRLFREHCTVCNRLYIKDLNTIGRDLKDTIIIDNNPISFAFNKDNGIPILTWHTNPYDNELMKLIPLLSYLTKVDDVRSVIRNFVNGDQVNFYKLNSILKDKNITHPYHDNNTNDFMTMFKGNTNNIKKRNEFNHEEEKNNSNPENIPKPKLKTFININRLVSLSSRKKDKMRIEHFSSRDFLYLDRKEQKLRDRIKERFNLNYETTKNSTFYDEKGTQFTEPKSKSKNHISSVDFYGKAYEKDSSKMENMDNLILPSNNCRSSSANSKPRKRRRKSTKQLFTPSLLNETTQGMDTEQIRTYRSGSHGHFNSYGTTLKRNTSSGYFRKYGFSFINPVNRGKFEFGFGSRVKQRYLNRKINHYTTQTATISLNDQSLGKSSSFHFPSSKENLKISLTYLGKNNRNLSPKLKQRINNINLTFNC